MSDLMGYVLNKNTIISAAPGEGSTTLALYLTNILSTSSNVLFFDTGNTLDKQYIKTHYNDMYNHCFIIQGSYDNFLNYLSDLNRQLSNLDYIIIDTGDIITKPNLLNLYNIFDACDINIICTSQLRVNPGTGKPYSTVEEWNKQLTKKPFDNSIWIRKVNEPNTFLNRKYIDIYKEFRIGNHYIDRSIFSFDRKKGNIL